MHKTARIPESFSGMGRNYKGGTIRQKGKKKDGYSAPGYEPVKINLQLEKDDDFFDRDQFHKFLLLERKRTERSGRPFMLLLVDIGRIIEEEDSDALQQMASVVVVNNIVRRLSQTTRETDIKGWYEKQKYVGIIYTEIGNTEGRKIVAKVENELCVVLDEKYARRIRLSWKCFPDINNKEAMSVDGEGMNFYSLPSQATIGNRMKLAMKRMLDIAGSLCGLIAFSPLIILFAILVKVTSKGPVFFRQERIGRGGKTFTFLKFRSMYIDNDNSVHKDFIKNYIKGGNESNSGNSHKIYKIRKDPRVTLVGRFLRKTSLDELPQFINVLLGEMSLVGPRPPIPYEADEYDIWHKRRVMEIKPGITGLWQVYGRSTTTFEEMVRMDIRYIKKWTLWLDIKLLMRTPWAVLWAKGAY